MKQFEITQKRKIELNRQKLEGHFEPMQDTTQDDLVDLLPNLDTSDLVFIRETRDVCLRSIVSEATEQVHEHHTDIYERRLSGPGNYTRPQDEAE